MNGFSSLFPTRDLSEAGETALAEGDHVNAVQLFRKAYEQDQGNTKTAYNLANAYHLTGEYSKAEGLYNIAIEIAMENGERELLPALHYNLGNTFFKKNEFEKAMENYKIVLEYNDNDLPAKKNYELALRKLQKYQRPQSPPQAQGQENSKEQDNQQRKNTGSGEGETPESQEESQGESDSTQPREDERSSTQSHSTNTEEGKNPSSEENGQGNASSDSSSKNFISLKRAEQILNAYENRQKRFESYRQYKQTVSKKLNTKNW